MLIAILGGLAVILASLMVVCQIRINQAHDKLLKQAKSTPSLNKDHSPSHASADTPKTYAKSDPTQLSDLYLAQQPQNLPDGGNARVTTAQAYWNQFQGIAPHEAKPWNPLDDDSFEFQRRSLMDSELEYDATNSDNNNSTNRAKSKLFLLQQAARLGHPQAQHVYAGALASGVLPLHGYDQVSLSELQVADDFLDTHSRQQQEAWLTWHMAATSGHVESAMALAHRYETLRQQAEAGNSKQNKRNKKNKNQNADTRSFQCSDVLPYYQAAAHGIMDKLEASPNSRAKVLPPTEKHLLYQVHLHGGTSSQLDWYNKPDESMEAIQFYHFKATRAVDPDPSAAMTLATYYHYGYRGIVQNLTLALQYYDLAAAAGSWEAAGLAGWFHVYGLGMNGQERDLFEAHKYFRQGLIGGLEGCQERHQKKKRFKSQDGIPQCDPACLNGMGLLHVFGVPLAVDVDLDEAMEFFTLAKDMGHADAAYNLAMVTLGWKSHYVSMEEAVTKQQQNQQKEKEEAASDTGTTKLDLPSFMEDDYQMSAGPTQLDMQHVVQYLMIAVQKGHLQARHRLALLYDTGVLSTSSADDKGRSNSRRAHNQRLKEVLPQDCDKALKHYKSIVDQASPQVLHRLRTAYKDYMAGELSSSLIQYMSLAELGNDVAQVNAAFLLEQGTCLGLSPTDCHKASARYWKAAAAVGNAEACLRVGDFYYYGKLRPPQDALASIWERPFGWAQYLIFPEKHLLPAVRTMAQDLVEELTVLFYAYMDPDGSALGSNSENELGEEEATPDGSCGSNEGEEGTCSSGFVVEEEDEAAAEARGKKHKEESERDLKMAAHYYRIAAEKHASPRANFNLAFLHEWGLGLTQDFPLAKRHYDLAASSVAASREADLAVQIALWTLAFHEYFVRLKMAWEDYFESTGSEDNASTGTSAIMEAVPRAISNLIGKPVPGPTSDTSYTKGGRVRKTKLDVIMEHLWTWESLVILILTIILWMLLQRRRTRGNRR